MMKTNMMNAIVCAVLVAGSVPALYAQQTTYQQRHSINTRDANQQARINRGVADGQITPKGAAAADARQNKINSEESNMRAADGGHLTAADRHKIARQQDRASRNIYNRNHNGATDPGVPPR